MVIDLVSKILDHDDYNSGSSTMSITDINSGEKEIILSRRHKGIIKNYEGETRKEKQRKIFSALGKAWDMYVDSIMDSDPDWLGHVRLYYPAKYKGKTYIVSGEIDLYHIPSGTIVDNKLVSMGKVARLQREAVEYTRQLNGYAWLMEQGYTDEACTQKFQYRANALALCTGARDYDQHQSRIDGLSMINIDLWPIEETRLMYMKKLKNIIDWEFYEDNDIPYCSPEMRWEGAITYPVIKLTKAGNRPKKPRAMPHTGGFTSEIEAKQYIETHADKHMLYFDKRGGEPLRCKEYCKCSGVVCDYLETRRTSI